MNELALFAGAGGGILGGHLLGWRTVCAVEIDCYCALVLVQRQNDGVLPPFPIWDDVRTFDGTAWRGIVGVVSAGFPCQPFSTAARGNNKPSKDLWADAVRVINEVQPSYVFAENVSRLAIDRSGDDLESLGYKTRAISLAASDLGADHIRRRHWLLAYTDDCAEPVRAVHGEEVAVLPELQTRVWSERPTESGVVDGMADGMVRSAATGNGQVPAVAAAAWRALTGE